MTITTKTLLVVLFIGAFYESVFNKDYQHAFQLSIIMLTILLVWYNERKL